MAEESRTIAVRFVPDPEERAAISAAVLAALPDWFGIPESTMQYVSDSRSQPFWAAEADGRVIGFLALKKTSPMTAEIAVMGVLPEYHRSGAGRLLADTAQDYARADGCRFMQVKTGLSPAPSRSWKQSAGWCGAAPAPAPASCPAGRGRP